MSREGQAKPAPKMEPTGDSIMFKPSYIVFFVAAIGVIGFRTDNGWTGSNPGSMAKSIQWAQNLFGTGIDIEILPE
jgi:hypothetical protein